MSDIEKLFLAAYPLWPKALLEKFSSLLSFEVAKFNPEINPQIIEQYKSLGVNQKIKIEPYTDNVNYLLSPSNSAKVVQVYYPKSVFSIGQFIYDNFPDNAINMQNEYRWYMGKIVYDYRIFKSVLASPSIEYTKWVREYRGGDFFSAWGYWVTAIGVVNIEVVLQNYSGASTALAMIENGVSVDVDQKLLFEFVTFLNAYNKYGGELAAANSLQAEKNRQTMTDYKNSISEKLNSRKNELNDLRTQISFAAKNETASAKRDMQSLTLSAQSLMVQLQDKLK